MELPRYVVFQSKKNKKYLRFNHEKGEVHGFLQFCGEELVSPYTKYEIERAKSNQNFVHFRCCYTNKYWAKLSSLHNWIVPHAHESVEDQSRLSCTLFEPIFDANHQAYRFRHLHSGKLLLFRTSGSCLTAEIEEPDPEFCDLINILNFESHSVLPKYVAFKGDNGLYLSAAGHEYLEFSGDDITDPKVANEIFLTSDGNIRIKSYHNEKFWIRGSSNWIGADSTDSSSPNRDTLFWPERSDDNTVSLRNLGNNNFCKRLTAEDRASCLIANDSTVSNEARLKVEELVVSREIYDIEFQVSEARIFDQILRTVAYDNLVNNGPEAINLETILSFTGEVTSAWSSTISTKLGITTIIKTAIPKIVGENFEFLSEYCGSYTWGEAKKVEQKMNHKFESVVPKGTEMKVSMIATKGCFNIPFSYTQRDTLADGRKVITKFEDGIFTGSNYSNFDFKKDETPL